MQYKFLLSPWKDEFIGTLSETQKELFISSPFLNLEGVKVLSGAIKIKKSIKISLVTNLTTKNIVNEVTEPSALLELYKQFPQVKISSLGRLHAKVYLIDDRVGIITSANLTSGGLINNFEYGVLIDDESIISAIKDDMVKYYSLGNILDKDLLERVNEESKKINRIRSKTQNLIENTKLRQLLRKSVDSLNFELLKNRVKEGNTINAIFSDTILYLLKKKGALTTEEIHPLVQTMHPDICDDSIDRVINGQHFGKKWKHLVRNAQQGLKKNQFIKLANGKWQLTNQKT